MSLSHLGTGTHDLALPDLGMEPDALLRVLLKVPGRASDTIWIPTITFPSRRAATPELGSWAQPSV